MAADCNCVLVTLLKRPSWRLFATEDANLPPHIFNASARAYQRSMTKKDTADTGQLLQCWQEIGDQ